MIRAVGTKGGRQVLFLGLSYGNLDRFRAGPGDSFIAIEGRELGLPIDVVLFSGETEAHCVELLEAGLGSGAKVQMDLRSKN